MKLLEELQKRFRAGELRGVLGMLEAYSKHTGDKNLLKTVTLQQAKLVNLENRNRTQASSPQLRQEWDEFRDAILSDFDDVDDAFLMKDLPGWNLGTDRSTPKDETKQYLPEQEHKPITTPSIEIFPLTLDEGKTPKTDEGEHDPTEKVIKETKDPLKESITSVPEAPNGGDTTAVVMRPSQASSRDTESVKDRDDRLGNQPTPASPKHSSWFWIIGLLLILASILLMVLIECPKNYLVFSMKLLMALGASIISWYFIDQGSIEVTIGKWLKAGGTIGFFVLIWALDPPGQMAQPCGLKDITVFIRGEDGVSNLPDVEGESLKIYVGNSPNNAIIDKEGRATFYGIPLECYASKTRIELLSSTIEVINPDSLYDLTKSKIIIEAKVKSKSPSYPPAPHTKTDTLGQSDEITDKEKSKNKTPTVKKNPTTDKKIFKEKETPTGGNVRIKPPSEQKPIIVDPPLPLGSDAKYYLLPDDDGEYDKNKEKEMKDKYGNVTRMQVGEFNKLRKKYGIRSSNLTEAEKEKIRQGEKFKAVEQ